MSNNRLITKEIFVLSTIFLGSVYIHTTSLVLLNKYGMDYIKMPVNLFMFVTSGVVLYGTLEEMRS